jgi:transketolase
MILHYVPRESIEKLTDLRQIADCLRLNILYMVQNGGGHIGSAFSIVDILTALYWQEVRPNDVVFSSKGHDVAAFYAALIARGAIPEAEMHNFRHLGGLPGHPDGETLPFHTGSLGMGLSKAQGMAIADRMQGIDRRIFVISGDGETQEGQIWEALRNIKNRNLSNIHLVVDCNGWQCDRTITETSDNGALGIKLMQFGWTVRSCNGHVYRDINRVLADTSIRTDAPKAYIAETQKGMWGKPFHAGRLSEDDYRRAVDEIKQRLPPWVVTYSRDILEKPIIEKANPFIAAYSEALASIHAKDERILICSADLASDCVISRFWGDPRFLEFGISEQDMISTAGALAKQGYLPIVHSFASFLCRRANEQIYNNCCEGDQVIYVGAMAGVIPPGPGPTHECLDDIALMRTMPGMEILWPKNDGDVAMAIRYAVYGAEHPVYIRLACLQMVEGMRL